MTTIEIILLVILCLIIVSMCIFIPVLLKKLSNKSTIQSNDTDILEKIGNQIIVALETQHKKDMEMIKEKMEANSKANKEGIEGIKKIVTDDLSKSVSTKFNESFKAIG